MKINNKVPYRMGLVYPGGGCETDFYTFENATNGAVRLYLSNSRFGTVDGDDHHPDALRQTADVEWILDAAQRLSLVNLDSLVWACTSGSFINGAKFAAQQVGEIESVLNIPTTSTSLAFVAALEELSINRVSVLATYPEIATSSFVAFLKENGIESINVVSLGFESGWISSKMQSSSLIEKALKTIDRKAEALLIPDTAMSSLAATKELYSLVGKPILTANLVSLWHGLKTGNKTLALPDYGPLFGGH